VEGGAGSEGGGEEAGARGEEIVPAGGGAGKDLVTDKLVRGEFVEEQVGFKRAIAREKEAREFMSSFGEGGGRRHFGDLKAGGAGKLASEGEGQETGQPGVGGLRGVVLEGEHGEPADRRPILRVVAAGGEQEQRGASGRQEGFPKGHEVRF
jgi:hypothetical protein